LILVVVVLKTKMQWPSYLLNWEGNKTLTQENSHDTIFRADREAADLASLILSASLDFIVVS